MTTRKCKIIWLALGFALYFYWTTLLYNRSKIGDVCLIQTLLYL